MRGTGPVKKRIRFPLDFIAAPRRFFFYPLPMNLYNIYYIILNVDLNAHWHEKHSH